MKCLENPKLFIVKDINRQESYKVIYNILRSNFKIINPQIDKDEYGKPYVLNERISFSISYCDNLMVCLFYNNEVGIDAERVREYNQLLVKKIFSKEEQRRIIDNNTFWEYWTIKESYLKYKGTGIIDELNTIEIEKIKNNKLYFHINRIDNYIIAICCKEKINKLEIEFIKRGVYGKKN